MENFDKDQIAALHEKIEDDGLKPSDLEESAQEINGRPAVFVRGYSYRISDGADTETYPDNDMKIIQELIRYICEHITHNYWEAGEYLCPTTGAPEKIEWDVPIWRVAYIYDTRTEKWEADDFDSESYQFEIEP